MEDYFTEGYVAAEQAAKMIRGNPIPDNTWVPAKIINRTNIGG